MIGVYAIRHIASNKRYVGSAVNIQKRWISHRSLLRHNLHGSIYLQYAWNKYGENAFAFDILEMTLRDKLRTIEQRWMVYYEVLNPGRGYNLAINATGGRQKGIRHTEEGRRRISEGLRGRKYSAESRSKMSAWQVGKVVSAETRAKMSAKLKGRVLSEEHKAKIAATWKSKNFKNPLGMAKALAARKWRPVKSLTSVAEATNIFAESHK